MLQDTIAAVATPLGESALGIVRLSGPQAISIVQSFFESAAPLAQAATQTCHVGRLRDGGVLDEAVVTLFRAPKSYTGEDLVEISSHGNPHLLQRLLGLCIRRGARLAKPGEFTERAFLNGRIDLTQAEAVIDLIRAKTDKAQNAALRQLEGHLAQAIRGLRNRLLPLLAHIEVGLDHSDEDHDFLPSELLLAQCRAARAEVDVLLKSGQVSQVLREGARVVLVGRPNVGKSSLMNALLKTERAIVTPIAGTTRDTLEETLDWEGVPVVLVDTAGLHQGTKDPVERLGVERTHRELESADLVVGLLDASEPITSDDDELIALCNPRPHVWALTKCDLPARLDLRVSAKSSLINGSIPIPLSSKTGAGLDKLIALVKAKVLGEKATSGEAQWLINARHEQALDRAREALAAAEQAAAGDDYEECVALELKMALQALGEIIGETTTEDLLDRIFSNFCIGK